MFIDKDGVVRKPKAYLGGFEIFFYDSEARGKRLKELCDKYGIIGIYPPDDEPDDEFKPYIAKDDSHEEIEMTYFTRDCNHIRRSDMIIAQLEDYHGTEPDSGTAFECGMAAALGQRLYAFIPDARDMKVRVKEMFPKSTVLEDGTVVDPEGYRVEDFGLPLNLMFSGCMKVAEGDIEAALKLARADFDAELVAAGYEPYEVGSGK